MNANLRNFALWVIIVLLLLALFTLFQNPGQRASSQDIAFSQLLSEVDRGNVRDVVIQGPDIHGTFTNGSSFQTYAPNDPTLVKRLYDSKVQITAKPPGDNVPWFVSLLVSWLPFIALIGVWIFLSRQMQGGAGKAMGLKVFKSIDAWVRRTLALSIPVRSTISCLKTREPRLTRTIRLSTVNSSPWRMGLRKLLSALTRGSPTECA